MPQGKARSQNVKSENSIKILNQGCISEEKYGNLQTWIDEVAHEAKYTPKVSDDGGKSYLFIIIILLRPIWLQRIVRNITGESVIHLQLRTSRLALLLEHKLTTQNLSLHETLCLFTVLFTVPLCLAKDSSNPLFIFSSYFIQLSTWHIQMSLLESNSSVSCLNTPFSIFHQDRLPCTSPPSTKMVWFCRGWGKK